MKDKSRKEVMSRGYIIWNFSEIYFGHPLALGMDGLPLMRTLKQWSAFLCPCFWKCGRFYLHNGSLSWRPALQLANVCTEISALDEENLPKATAAQDSSFEHPWRLPEPWAATFDVHFVIRKERRKSNSILFSRALSHRWEFCWLKAFSDVNFALSY